VGFEPRHCASKDTLSELDLAHVNNCVLGRQQVPFKDKFLKKDHCHGEKQDCFCKSNKSGRT
jgi:hypothetical protein